MSDGRTVRRTRYPGIYRVSRGGRADRFMVSYRVRGVGQRTKTLPTLTEAVSFQASVRDPRRAQELARFDRERLTLEGYLPIFLERRRNLAPTTRARYEGLGRRYIAPGRLGSRRLPEIGRDDVEGWIGDLEAAGVGAATVDKAYRTLRAILNTAVREGRIPSNPASSIATRDPGHREAFFLTAAQVDAIAGAVPERYGALVYFLAYTGVRIGEASALRVRHLDLLRRVVRVVENSPEVDGRKVTGRPKSGRARVIDLAEALCNELATHVDRFGARGADGEIDPDGFVFPGERGAQLRQNNFRARVFQPACVRLGITRPRSDGRAEPPHVHDLRHTAASLAAAAGYSLHEVKSLLGHSTIGLTSDLYLHLFDEENRANAARLSAVFDGARRTGSDVVELRRNR